MTLQGSSHDFTCKNLFSSSLFPDYRAPLLQAGIEDVRTITTPILYTYHQTTGWAQDPDRDNLRTPSHSAYGGHVTQGRRNRILA